MLFQTLWKSLKPKKIGPFQLLSITPSGQYGFSIAKTFLKVEEFPKEINIFVQNSWIFQNFQAKFKKIHGFPSKMTKILSGFPMISKFSSGCPIQSFS